MDWSEILLRLGVATLAGGAIGLNRDLHGKPIGLKTFNNTPERARSSACIASTDLPSSNTSPEVIV